MLRKTKNSAVILSWLLGILFLLSVFSIPADQANAATPVEKQYPIASNTIQTYALSTGTLAIPSISTPTNTASGVKISWSKVDGATGYYVYRKVSGGSWKRIATINNGSTVSTTDTTAVSGTTYYYTVRAIRGSELGSYNKTGKSITYLKQPKPSVKNSSTGVTVSWNNITGASGYYVYRKTASASSWTKIATINSNSVLSYTDTRAASGNTYTYTVKSFNGSSYSSHSGTGATTKYLSQPTVSVANTSNSVKITWSKSAGASGYYVYRKVPGGTWSKIATINNVNTLSYSDTKPSSGSQYIYTVKSYSGSTVSSYNTSGKSIMFLGQPTPSAKTAATGVNISWNNISGATGYYVYRKTPSASSWSKIATITNGSTVTYTDTKAVSGNTYLYTVKSYNGSSYSTHNSTGSTVKYLSQPTVSVKNTSTGVEINWSKSAGASGYYVYRKTSSSGSWTRIANISSVNTLTYTDTQAKSGTTYLYTVKAYSGSTYSTYDTGKTIQYKKAQDTAAYYIIDLGNGKTTTVYGYYNTAMADEIVSQLNAYRKSKGLSTLTQTDALTNASATRATEISYLMDHTRPNGTKCFTVNLEVYAENVAGGFPDATAVMTAWKNSSGHNANMLRAEYRTIGVSVFVAQSGDKEGYRTYFVQNFGY